MHVALAIPHLGGGGAERSTLALARGLIERDHSVDLLLFYDNMVLKHEVPQEARLVVLHPARQANLLHRIQLAKQPTLVAALCLRGRHLRYAASISDYLDLRQPDVLMPALAEPKIASLVALTSANPRPLLVPVFRNSMLSRSRRTRILYRSLLKNADHIVTVSDGVADGLSALASVPQDRMTTIYNPVVTPDLVAKAEDRPDHPWFLEPGPPIILAAGRLSRVKDFPTLIRAFHIASRKRPMRLIILGEGSWRKRLEKLVRKKGLDNAVSLPGWRDNPFAFMRRAALFVVSSKYEGLSGALIQALACGCAAISTDCPSGSREILDNGRIGHLVPVGDHKALADAIIRMLDTSPNSRLLQNWARRFSFEASISRYDELLRTVAAQRSTSS